MSLFKWLDKDGLLYFWTLMKSKFVAKETGKGLSANDYTDAEKTKLSGITAGAEPNILTSISVNGKVQTIANKTAAITVPTKVSELTNDKGYTKVEDTATNGAIKVDGKEQTVYTHPTVTAETAAFKKVGMDANGHVVLGASITKADITSLGIPAQDTTYAAATASVAGLMSAADKSKLDGIDQTIQSAVAGAGHLKRQIVDALPAVGTADANTIYMVMEDADSGSNKYIEYMVVSGAWERVGSSDVDLSGYVKSSDITAITNSEIDTIVAT